MSPVMCSQRDSTKPSKLAPSGIATMSWRCRGNLRSMFVFRSSGPRLRTKLTGQCLWWVGSLVKRDISGFLDGTMAKKRRPRSWQVPPNPLFRGRGYWNYFRLQSHLGAYFRIDSRRGTCTVADSSPTGIARLVCAMEERPLLAALDLPQARDSPSDLRAHKSTTVPSQSNWSWTHTVFIGWVPSKNAPRSWISV
jgi:hypothetical protein